jgi:arabinose-5-phosphate isomerase
MIKELFDTERSYLNHFFDNINIEATEKLLDLLVKCEGVIILSGIGKSGLVAEKIALTLTSTGSRALFLSPINALHGDIGIVSDKDIFLMLSKSGESEELLNLIPALRNKKVKIIGIISKPNSRLAKSCDFVVNLPVEKELCPFDIVPTTSTVVQLIYGDVLSIALMRQKNFSLVQFAENHPGGRIGKRISMKVNDLMLRGNDIPLCNPDDKLVDILVELSNKRCGCVLVKDPEGFLLGIFTDGDLRRALQSRGPAALNTRIEDMMTKAPRWITPESLAWDAMQVMEGDQKHAIAILAVLDDNKKIAGLIKLHDIVQSGL